MPGPVSYLRQQSDEIAADPALRLYALALLATNALTAYWLWSSGRAALLGAGVEAICWPLLPDCERLRVLSAEQLQLAFAAYGVLSVLCGLAFLRRSTAGAGYAGLVLLTLFKLAVIALDFRLRRNQHYMAFAVSAVFLFVPRKRESLQVLIVLFYFWAGTLKLNWEWFSGSALYRPLWLLSGWMVVAACAYVVVLELVVVFGLLSRRRSIFGSSFAQVLLFHVMSWAVVGFFYPLLMFALLSIFPLARLLPAPGEAEPASVGERFWSGRLSRAALAVGGVFSLVQLTTHLYPGDTAITGEGRLFALHMFDARVECEPKVTLKWSDGRSRSGRLQTGGVRTGCDPLMVHGVARNLCRRRDAGEVEFADFDLELRARRSSSAAEPRTVVHIVDFCRNQPRYDAFLHNDWIAAR